jgi:large subunit ribosomal protein L6e
MFCPQPAHKWYPAEDRKPRKASHAVMKKKNPPKIRASITPGKVVIILAGRFKGKRCVCLKTLPSGLLLVSGPYKLNGVPLRRVHPAYVIATSTSVDVSSIDVSSFTDKQFKQPKSKGKKEGEEEFFEGESKKAIVSDERKADQSKIDAELLNAVKAVDSLDSYLSAHFTLRKGDLPHKMKF